ncbi:cysteine hydrolase family protein [Penicillium longicatenatum]|uniref:cysteine hydrolase family protein n=1 Tax=Penicillium longicatenatum TaxID=1561947 RepID=UPI0025472AD4|nr:cysteine hydrolase family protein [Penicillium longicatenatum]KAJ5650524.1 cysteine hydrolase family protein [Penicillium longicatenatum]
MEFLAWAFLALAPCFVDSTAIGYSNSTPSTVTSSSLSFGPHYAVLNLDLINAFVGSINATSQGQAFIKNTAKWIDATISDLGNITESDVESHLYQAFKPLSDYDVVLQKTRYYAGAENTLVQILRNHKINTVVLSGLRTSGVVLTTAQRLFDLDFNVYVIANNTIEMGSDAAMIYDAILQGILPKMPLNVITVEQAIDALSRSKVAY